MTPYKRPLRPLGLVILAAATLVLTGCGMFSWLGGAKDPRPPTKLDKKAVPQSGLRVIWKTKIGKGSDKRTLALVPAVGAGRVYAADARGRVVALSATDGRQVWRRDTKIPFSGGPEVAGERLIIGSTDGDLVALSTRDGTQRWRTQLGSEVLSVPRVVGDLVVVHTVDDNVYGINVNDGSERWRYVHPAPILTLHGSSTPVAAGEGVVVGISGGRLVYLDTEEGAPFWEVVVTRPSGRTELDRIADVDANPVVVGDVVYVASFNGDLGAVDLLTGTILWRRELSAHAGIAATPEALYITDSDDNLWAAEPTDGAGRWKQDALLYRRVTAPAVLGNRLIVGDLEGWLHLVDRNDGRLIGRVRAAKSPINHTPVIASGVVYVYAADGTLAALR
jgi:outer membrane protein assembly factor BamB